MKQMTFDLLSPPTASSEGLKYDPTVTKLEAIHRTTTDAVLIRLIDSLYSADKIRPYSKTKIGYAKGYVELEGRLWCCTACGGNATVSVDEVLPGTYPDMPKRVQYSYSGEVITIRSASTIVSRFSCTATSRCWSTNRVTICASSALVLGWILVGALTLCFACGDTALTINLPINPGKTGKLSKKLALRVPLAVASITGNI